MRMVDLEAWDHQGAINRCTDAAGIIGTSGIHRNWQTPGLAQIPFKNAVERAAIDVATTARWRETGLAEWRDAVRKDCIGRECPSDCGCCFGDFRRECGESHVPFFPFRWCSRGLSRLHRDGRGCGHLRADRLTTPTLNSPGVPGEGIRMCFFSYAIALVPQTGGGN